MTRASSPTETLKNRKSINIISIIAITGIVIGLIAAGIVAVFSLTKEKAPEALFAPLLTPLPDPSTATTIPFASPVFTFGGEGTGAGLFSDARTIGVDRQGKIYVGDIETRLVQVFDPDGNYLTQWHTGQKDDGKDLFLAGMAVDLNGQVYIASSDAIHIYNGQTGERLGILTYPGNGYFEDVTITPDGSVVAVYFTHQENIIRFNCDAYAASQPQVPFGAGERDLGWPWVSHQNPKRRDPDFWQIFVEEIPIAVDSVDYFCADFHVVIASPREVLRLECRRA